LGRTYLDRNKDNNKEEHIKAEISIRIRTELTYLGRTFKYRNKDKNKDRTGISSLELS
jgi:hypothetical protein